MEFEKNPEKSWKNHGILLKNMTKPPVARKLAVGHMCVRQLVFMCVGQLVFWLLVACPTASFLATGGFKFKLFQNACMVYKHAVVTAFHIYSQHGEVVAKRGDWSLCIKQSWKLHC